MKAWSGSRGVNEMAAGKTFKGGINPHYGKELTSVKAIRPAPRPREVVIPLQQHIGAPADPLVDMGERVEIGQAIGRSQA